jgi:hypothetical protein
LLNFFSSPPLKREKLLDRNDDLQVLIIKVALLVVPLKLGSLTAFNVSSILFR